MAPAPCARRRRRSPPSKSKPDPPGGSSTSARGVLAGFGSRLRSQRPRERRRGRRSPGPAAGRIGTVEYRTLGRTGMHVSTFCLGTMVLGAWGNRDEDECPAIVHTALDAGSTSSTPRTCTRSGSRRRSSGGRCAAGGMPSSWRPSSSTPWARTRTTGARRAAGSCGPSRTACAASTPTGSTCTRCTGPIPIPTWTRRSARCPTWCTPGRSGPSGRRRSRPSCWSRRSGWRTGGVTSCRRPSSRRTRSSPAASNGRCCRRASATGSACSCGPRSTADG